MRFIINDSGNLLIERKDRLNNTECPFSVNVKEMDSRCCGDWCALFGEPDYISIENSVVIQLCKKSITIKSNRFEDLRP
jgi:hypothetical protein